MQHRGQEATGITTFFKDKDKYKYASHKRPGLVLDIFSDPHIFSDKLIGDMAIGHNRYATTGSTLETNIQPLNMKYANGVLALAHNGNLSNTNTLRRSLQSKGAIFHTTTDSELFLHLIAHSKQKSQVDQIREALSQTKGAFSLAILSEEGLVAARDPHGVRPLSVGRVKVDGRYAYVVASETCAFDMIDAEEIRSVKHNEIIIIDDDTLKTGNIKSFNIEPETPEAKHCIFEYIYFARPDSRVFGHNVDKIRRKLGKNLAQEYPTEVIYDEIPDNGEVVDYVDGDSKIINGKLMKKVNVISVPDSANTAAMGYARTNQKDNKIETAYEVGLIRSHYVGRTFIQAGQDNREFKVKSKFNTVKGVIENRNIVIVDDSIVRGTTSLALVKLIRKANPTKLHMRVTSPPIICPCHYGMDFPSRKELIANHYKNEEEIGEALGVDSLHYLSIEKLMESVPKEEGIGYCTACFTGDYPIELEDELER
jgi:amidophosphoribosyltransferase